MRFNLALLLATVLSAVSGQLVSVNLGASASGSTSTSPSSVITSAGSTIASILVAGSGIAAQSFTLVGSVLTVVQTTVDSLGLGPAITAAPGTVEGLVLSVGSLVSSGATSITLTLAAPTATVFDVFTSTVPGVVGPLLASVPIATPLPPLPSLPPVAPLVSSLPLPTLPSVPSLVSAVPTVLGSVLSPLLTPVLGTVGSLLSPIIPVSPGVIGTVVVPLTSATSAITLLVDGNILNILNITVKFNKP